MSRSVKEEEKVLGYATKLCDCQSLLYQFQT